MRPSWSNFNFLYVTILCFFSFCLKFCIVTHLCSSSQKQLEGREKTNVLFQISGFVALNRTGKHYDILLRTSRVRGSLRSCQLILWGHRVQNVKAIMDNSLLSVCPCPSCLCFSEQTTSASTPPLVTCQIKGRLFDHFTPLNHISRDFSRHLADYF